MGLNSEHGRALFLMSFLEAGQGLFIERGLSTRYSK
jgi:hypothetical protein